MVGKVCLSALLWPLLVLATGLRVPSQHHLPSKRDIGLGGSLQSLDLQGDALQEASMNFDPFGSIWKAALRGAEIAAKAIPMAAVGTAAAPLMGPALAAGAVGAVGAGVAGAAASGAATISQALMDVSDPDVGVEMEELVNRRGFPVERHRVVTEDGYVLGVFRIPHGRDPNAPPAGQLKQRPVVLLQHGVLDSSLAFVANFQDQSLAYILADAGYDVWMGNNRGNRYSRGHQHLSPWSSQFWNFSWTEMAEHDLPAEINYILQHTQQRRLAYIAHSEGSTQAFAAFSTNETLAAQVSVFVAMAPVTFVGSQRVGFLRAAASLGLDKLVQMLGDGVFYFNTQTANAISPISCRALSMGCNFLMEAFAGRSEQLNQSRIHVYATMFPAGTSTRNVRHWVGAIKNMDFARYDYGDPETNLRAYGVPNPPRYNLDRLRVPTALFAGKHDQMADPEDVARLQRELHPGVIFKFREVSTYAHLDFILAQDAKARIYMEVLDAIATHMP